MRAFWAVLAALILAGGAFVFISARASARSAEAAAAEQQAARKAEADSAAAAAKVAAAQAEASRQATPGDASLGQIQSVISQKQSAAKKEEAAKKLAAGTENAGADAKDAQKSEAPKDEPKADTPKVDAPKADAPKADGPESKPDAKQDKPADSKPKTDGAADKKDAEQPKAPSNSGFSINDGSVAPVGVTGTPTSQKPVVATVKQDKPPTFAGFEVIPAKIEKKDDGSQLVDGKYLIKGEGTAEKPYVVPWDVLTSVEETFDPQSGKKKLPERVTMLDGKVVKFSGYIAFPLMMKEAKECLSMLNQWDGCCIGVPPTPYDAVEVTLTRTIKGEERFTTSGVVTGVFRVKPYLQGDWLIGLYVLDGGDLKSRDFGGSAGS
jgi:hypothetical protein